MANRNPTEASFDDAALEAEYRAWLATDYEPISGGWLY